MELTLDFQILFELVLGAVFIALYLGGFLSGRAALPRAGKRKADPQKADAAPTPPPAHAREENDAASQRSPSLEQLRDHEWVVTQILQLSNVQFRQAFKVYRSATEAGLSLQTIPEEQREQMLVTLAVSAIRLNSCNLVMELLKELRRQGLGMMEGLLVSVVKSCAAKQLFAECLGIYEAAEKGGLLKGLEVRDRSVWSCLLLCAVEKSSHQSGRQFLERLRASGALTAKDFGNALRLTLMTSDWEQSVSLLRDARARGIAVDVVKFNTVLGTCVAAHQMERALQLLEEMEDMEVADVVAYNTIMKGYAQQGCLDKCFEVRRRMASKGLAASQVTHGILLNACVSQGATEHMAEVFSALKEDQCPMNTVLYTTMIKGFARAGQVDQAMSVYQQMRRDKGAPPDLISFSVLIKANCDANRLESALELLEQMKKMGITPDEIVFNNLLTGCAVRKDVTLGERVYGDMVSGGVQPSAVTFSILIRLYMECKLLDRAVEAVVQEPVRHGVAHEPRLFLQVVQCCLRHRQGRRAVEAYQQMLHCAPPDTAAHSSIFRTCGRLNMLDTAGEILELAVEGKRQVAAEDLGALLDVFSRKQRSELVDLCAKAARQLGVPLKAAQA